MLGTPDCKGLFTHERTTHPLHSGRSCCTRRLSNTYLNVYIWTASLVHTMPIAVLPRSPQTLLLCAPAPLPFALDREGVLHHLPDVGEPL